MQPTPQLWHARLAREGCCAQSACLCCDAAARHLPVAHVPCGCGCSRAELAAGGCRRSAALRGRTPGGTGGWGQGSWKGACGPRPSTSAAVRAGWPGGGPGPLQPLHPTVNVSVLTHSKSGATGLERGAHPLLPAGAAGAGLDWQLDDWEDRRVVEAPLAGLGLWGLQRAAGAVGVDARWHWGADTAEAWDLETLAQRNDK